MNVKLLAEKLVSRLLEGDVASSFRENVRLRKGASGHYAVFSSRPHLSVRAGRDGKIYYRSQEALRKALIKAGFAILRESLHESRYVTGTVYRGDQEIAVEVEYSHSAGSSGSRDSFGAPIEPDEPADVELGAVTALDSDLEIELTPEEAQEFYEKAADDLQENPSELDSSYFEPDRYEDI
jgi:hypothetical protein